VEFSSKMVVLRDNKKIKAQIWDTGTMIFIFSGPIAISIHYSSVSVFSIRHYRKALGALVVYDITKYESF
jgi:GTPase SAR1 family protein